MESKVEQKKRAAKILARLRKAYPDAGCELNISNPLELAVATILSAQCTDKRVNLTTPAPYCRAIGPRENFASSASRTVVTPFRTTVIRGPLAVTTSVFHRPPALTISSGLATLTIAPVR